MEGHFGRQYESIYSSRFEHILEVFDWESIVFYLSTCTEAGKTRFEFLRNPFFSPTKLNRMSSRRGLNAFGASELDASLSNDVDPNLKVDVVAENYKHSFKPKSDDIVERKIHRGNKLSSLKQIVERERYMNDRSQSSQEAFEEAEVVSEFETKRKESDVLEQRRAELQVELQSHSSNAPCAKKDTRTEIMTKTIKIAVSEAIISEGESDSERRRIRTRSSSSDSSLDIKLSQPLSLPKSNKDSESSSSGSESSSSSSESSSSEPQRVVFVSKSQRKIELLRKQQVEHDMKHLRHRDILKEKDSLQAREKIELETKRMHGETRSKSATLQGWPDDTDGLDEETEYQAWKVREIKRIQRNIEKELEMQRQLLDTERRRLLTDAERAREDAELEKLGMKQ